MEISNYIEYTNIDNKATMREIEALCNQAIKYHIEAVCVSPYYVSLTSALLKNTNVLVSTIVGYGNGMNTTSTKAYEAIEAINNGADEIDLVINIGAIKNKDYDYVQSEIEEIRDSIDGKPLKIVVNIDDLTDEEFKKLIQICNETFINYITLNSSNQIDLDKIKLINEHKSEILQIKVNDEENIFKLIDLDVKRIGMTNITKIMEVENETI